jgi:hypothetical protein
VIDDVALVDELVDDRAREDGVDHEVEVAAVHEVLDVPSRAGREVVENIDLPTVLQQRLREVRSHEAGAARDQRFARVQGETLAGAARPDE